MVTKRTLSVLSAAFVTAGLSMGLAHARIHHHEADEARNTLRDIKVLASEVQDQADQLIHVSENPNMSPQSHLVRLDAMKDDVNQMGRDLSVLEAERDTLKPWEQNAIDDTLPQLREAATNLEAAIDYFNA